MGQPVTPPPPIQPPRQQYQPPAPKPVNAGLVVALVVAAIVVTGLAIWTGMEQQRKLAGPAAAGVDDPKRREILIAAGHDPDEDYPLWPLVFDDNYNAVEENGVDFIKGKITNHGTKNYDFVEVDFKLYDENGNVIGSTSDSISNLAAGETWVYKAILFTRKWKTCKVVDVRAF